MPVEVVFTRSNPAAEVIERLIQGTQASVDAALYRLNNPRLARALGEAAQRGVRVRLVLDHGKYKETRATREILAEERIPFRVIDGRRGAGSKMHHKFAILDGRTGLTGSYNWTLESEDENFESFVILREPEVVEAYCREFETLWAEASEAVRT